MSDVATGRMMKGREGFMARYRRASIGLRSSACRAAGAPVVMATRGPAECRMLARQDDLRPVAQSIASIGNDSFSDPQAGND